MNWKFTDQTNTVAFRVLDDGRMESMLAYALPEGNTPEPYVAPPPPVPSTVSRFQARAALVQSGWFTMVDGFMAALDPQDIRRMAWEDATTFDRSSATLKAMQQMLGLSEAAMDSLFTLAASIEA